jgi:PIN domain nuclease of toxin-antitoxin system
VKPILLDTHSLLWLGNAAHLTFAAETAVAAARESETIFTSAICIWELATAARKNHPLRRPDLHGQTPRTWFDIAIKRLQVQVLPVSADISAEAADVAPLYGSGDPGDCFLIATARIHKLTLVTRDHRILEMAAADPAYLSVIRC